MLIKKAAFQDSIIYKILEQIADESSLHDCKRSYII
jgi:hypothetical protein